MSDYLTDTKSVLDQAVRVLQAMVDVCATAGWLETTLQVMTLAQMVSQGRYDSDSTLLNLPGMNNSLLTALAKKKVENLREVTMLAPKELVQVARNCGVNDKQARELSQVVGNLPVVDIRVRVDPQQCVYTGEEESVRIELCRKSKVGKGMVFAPHFPKPKKEGWWLVLGRRGPEGETELLALKRVMVRGGSNEHELNFDAPETAGNHLFTIYLVSDSYLGLDKQHEFTLSVETKP
jgi:hypothetical protein